MVRRILCSSLLLACGAAAIPAAADGAVTLGRSPLPERSGVEPSGATTQQLRFNIAVPGFLVKSPFTHGVVVRWRVRGGGGIQVLGPDSWILRVIHQDGTLFTPTASSAPQTVPGDAEPSQIYAPATRLRIAGNDFIGVTKGTAPIPYFTSAAGQYVTMDPIADGVAGSIMAAPAPNRELLVNADVEPDVDNDGWGDETQDGCPTNATTHGACPVVPPPPPPPDTVKPVLSGVKLNKTKTTKGLTFSFTLSEPAVVSVKFQRKTTGRKVGGKCKKKTAANAKKKSCTRVVGIGSISFAGAAGANSHKWSGKLKGKQVRPGRYRADVSSADAANNVSKTKTKSFKIIKKT